MRFASVAFALRPENSWVHTTLAEALAASNVPTPFSLVVGGMRGAAHHSDDPASWAMAKIFPQSPFFSPGPVVALDSFIFTSYFRLGEPWCELASRRPERIAVNDEIIEECRKAVGLNPDHAGLRRGFARLLMDTCMENLIWQSGNTRVIYDSNQ